MICNFNYTTAQFLFAVNKFSLHLWPSCHPDNHLDWAAEWNNRDWHHYHRSPDANFDPFYAIVFYQLSTNSYRDKTVTLLHAELKYSPSILLFSVCFFNSYSLLIAALNKLQVSMLYLTFRCLFLMYNSASTPKTHVEFWSKYCRDSCICDIALAIYSNFKTCLYLKSNWYAYA